MLAFASFANGFTYLVPWDCRSKKRGVLLFRLRCNERGPERSIYCAPGPNVLRAYGGFAVVLVKQTRHVVFLHKSAGAGQALRGELLGRDAGAKNLLGRADGGDRAALLGGKGLDALRVGGRLGLEQRRVEVHQAVVARDQRDVAVFLEHLRIQQLAAAVDGVLKALAVGLGSASGKCDTHHAAVLKDKLSTSTSAGSR